MTSKIGDAADQGEHNDGNEHHRGIALALAEGEQIAEPVLPPTSSPTMTPMTARVEPMRSPANSAGIEAGNSIFQKICIRLLKGAREIDQVGDRPSRTAAAH